MTIEIRQMVIKSSIEDGDAAPASDEHKHDPGDGAEQGHPERLRLRALLSVELERMWER
jgi:hypothetical protein